MRNLLARALLCLCLAAPAWAAPTHIRFWHAQRGQRATLVDRLVARFQAENPDIVVDTRAVLDNSQRLGNDYAALYRALLESLAQKNAPDVSQLYENWITQLVDVNALVPLGTDFRDVTADLVPTFLESSRLPDGRIFSMPFNKSVWVLYCNRSMLKKYGLHVPQTWDELRATALSARKASKLPGLVFQPGVDAFGHLLLAEGGHFLDSMGRPAFDSPAGLKALKFWVALVHEDQSSLPTLKAVDYFAQGRACMLIDTTSKIGRLETEPNLEFDVAALPAGSVSRTQMAGTNVGAFRSGDLAREKAAIRFLRFLSSKAVTTLWGEESGYIPVRQSALASPEYRSFLELHPNHRAGVASLSNAVVQPRVAGWESVRGLLDDAFFSALSRQTTPELALQQAGKSAAQLLERLGGQATP